MNSAAEGMREVLKGFDIKTPEMTVYANKTALPYGDEVREIMADQIISPVKWQTTIENMVADGFDTFIETGVGKVLSGLIKKIAPDVNVYNVEDAESLKNTVEAVKNNG
jgi:[acyl-carrier-protein] S-malonyltransferase